MMPHAGSSGASLCGLLFGWEWYGRDPEQSNVNHAPSAPSLVLTYSTHSWYLFNR